MLLQVFVEEHNTMLQESNENFLRKTVFKHTLQYAADGRQNAIWITKMFAVKQTWWKQEQFENNGGSNCAKT